MDVFYCCFVFYKLEVPQNVGLCGRVSPEPRDAIALDLLRLNSACVSLRDEKRHIRRGMENVTSIFFGPVDFAAMAQMIDLVPWPEDACPIYAAPAVLIPVEPRRTMLAAVKNSIYHPFLPTLRKMDMDTVASKLTNEHCRTTTLCSKGKGHGQLTDIEH